MTRQTKISLVTVVVGIVLLIAFTMRRTESARDEVHFDAAKLKDGTSWIQVNAKPYRISPIVATDCRAPMPVDFEFERKRNPHAASYITVYVNKVGRDAMFAKEVQRFPEGSIIVKEKISTKLEGSRPLLYTLMKKREPGYNPKVGDWEFSVVGPDGKQLQASGKLENCESCHKHKSASDFVFRPYLDSN